VKPIRALLIEDNAAARAALRDRLGAHPAVAVVGEAGTVGRARTLLALGGYDLVFLDIRLRGGLGFDLVPQVTPAARIIFVTAFDEYALRAFEVNALDYLLKPVTPERLAAALARLGEPASAAPPARLRADDLVHLRTDAGSQFVEAGSIGAILAELNYTLVHLASGVRHLVRRPMKSWEEQLDPALFLRISRDTLVNLAQVVRHERDDHKGGRVWVAGRAGPLQSSRRHWPAVRAKLEHF
jgi:two-component system LytT family response regulator